HPRTARCSRTRLLWPRSWFDRFCARCVRSSATRRSSLSPRSPRRCRIDSCCRSRRRAPSAAKMSMQTNVPRRWNFWGPYRFSRRLTKRTTSMKSREKAKEPSGGSNFFGELANKTSLAAGRASTFIIAAGIVIVWAVSGPFFGFSDTWQLVINTGTTIVTFLMVFLIQNSQNRDSAAIQVKLDELIRVSAARNSMIGIEHLTDEEIEDLRGKCEARARAEKTAEKTVDKPRKSAKRAAEKVGT